MLCCSLTGEEEEETAGTQESLNKVDESRFQRSRSKDDKKPAWTRLGPDDNNCEFCSSFACKSKDKGGSSKCICRHNSTFDLKKLSKGNARHVVLARTYHKTNPSVSSLKNKKFTLGRGTEGGASEANNQGSVAALVSYQDLVTHTGGEHAEVDEWLSSQGVSLDDTFAACDRRPRTH